MSGIDLYQRAGCAEYFAMSIVYIDIGFTSTKEYKSRGEWERFEMGVQQRSSQRSPIICIPTKFFFRIHYIRLFVPFKILLSDWHCIFLLCQLIALTTCKIIPSFFEHDIKDILNVFVINERFLLNIQIEICMCIHETSICSASEFRAITFR